MSAIEAHSRPAFSQQIASMGIVIGIAIPTALHKNSGWPLDVELGLAATPLSCAISLIFVQSSIPT
jgi:hypothetical protein